MVDVITRNKRCKWSKHDIKFLTENYTEYTVEQLSIILRRSIWAIRSQVKRLKLHKNFSLEKINETHYKCCYCNEIKNTTKFPKKVKTKCNLCINGYYKKTYRKDPKAYFDNYARSLKHRSKQEEIPFNLTGKYLYELFLEQEEKCFYTDKDLKRYTDDRYSRISADRIVPSNGYVVGNVVFCTSFVNSVKNSASLEFIKKHMPGWYERIISFLPNLQITD